MFEIKGRGNKKRILKKLSGEFFYLNTEKSLKAVARLIMEDVNILSKDKQGLYRLIGSATLYPVSWRVKDKLNYNLKELHSYVPVWKEALASVVNNHFDRIIKKDKLYMRANLFIQNNSALYTPEKL